MGMELFGAFLVCAFLCVACQLVCELFPNVEGPTLFIGIILLAAFLTPLGTTAALAALGNSGMMVTVFTVGFGMYNGAMALLGQGNIVPILTLLGVFVCVDLIGMAAGALYHRRMTKQDEKSDHGISTKQ